MTRQSGRRMSQSEFEREMERDVPFSKTTYTNTFRVENADDEQMIEEMDRKQRLLERYFEDHDDD